MNKQAQMYSAFGDWLIQGISVFSSECRVQIELVQKENKSESNNPTTVTVSF